MRCKGHACSHLICIALHPLCSHLYTRLFPKSMLFLSSIQLFLGHPHPQPKVTGSGKKMVVLTS